MLTTLVSFTRISVFVNLLVLGFGSTVAAQDRPSRVLTVEALLGGESCAFILDTGASLHAIGSVHSKHLKPIGFGEVSSTGGSSQQQVFQIDALQINDTPAVISAAIEIDTERISQLVGTHVAGILGCHALQFGPVKIIDGTKAEYLPNGQEEPSNADEEFHISFDQHGRPFFCEVIVAGSRQFMLLDTGFRGSVSVCATVFNGLLSSGDIEDVSSMRMGTIHGETEMRSGRLKLLRLREFEFRDVPVIESNENSLGLDFFKGTELVIDFHRYSFYLLKRPAHWSRRQSKGSGCAGIKPVLDRE